MDRFLPADLPFTEFKVTFDDGSVATVSVAPDQTLEHSLEEMLQAAGATAEEVKSVELLGEFSLPELSKRP